MGLRLGLGLGGGGGRSSVDTDALAFFTRAGIASGTVTIPLLTNKNRLTLSTAPTSTTGTFWNITGSGTWGAVSGTLPDGTTGNFGQITATTTTGPWVRDAGGNTTYMSNLPSSNTYTLSVYLKANTTSLGRLNLLAGGVDRIAEFNLSLGTVTTTTNGAIASISSAGNGWYRCVVTAPAAGSVTSTHIARLAPTCAIGDSIYYCQPQLEIGTSATTYVPTTGNPATGTISNIVVNPRQQIINFVKGLKTLGLWNTVACWPLRSFQNSSTTLSIKSLGGLGTFDGTIANTSAAVAWRTSGLYMTPVSGHVATVPVFPSPVYNLGILINRDTISTAFGTRFTTGSTRTPWLTVSATSTVNVSQYGAVSATGELTSSASPSMFYGSYGYFSAGQTATSTLSLLVNGSLLTSNTASSILSYTGSQSNSLVASGAGLTGSHTLPFAIATTSLTDAIGLSGLYNLYKTTLGEGLPMD